MILLSTFSFNHDITYKFLWFQDTSNVLFINNDCYLVNFTFFLLLDRGPEPSRIKLVTPRLGMLGDLYSSSRYFPLMTGTEYPFDIRKWVFLKSVNKWLGTIEQISDILLNFYHIHQAYNIWISFGRPRINISAHRFHSHVAAVIQAKEETTYY